MSDTCRNPESLPASTSLRRIESVGHPDPQATRDWLAEEVPVAIEVNGRTFATMLATPQDLEDYAYGFSLTEGIIQQGDAIISVTTQSLPLGIVLQIQLRADIPAPDQIVNARVGRTGCGLCGRSTLAQIGQAPTEVPNKTRLTTAGLTTALFQLEQKQPLRKLTGATHAAAWASCDGTIITLREDVGRHNALDKLIGAMLRTTAPNPAGFALVTSRASYEMAHKAATAGIEILIAVSAPTALAVRVAEQAGLTLIGFARSGRHVIYSGAHRIS